MSTRTTPKLIAVSLVNVAPGAGVDVHTCQLRSSTWFRPRPVRSVELVKNTSSLVSAWMASYAACRFRPVRSGIVQLRVGAEVGTTTEVGASVSSVGAAATEVTVSRTVTVDGELSACSLPHPASVTAVATVNKISRRIRIPPLLMSRN